MVAGVEQDTFAPQLGVGKVWMNPIDLHVNSESFVSGNFFLESFCVN
jgi:hypothetical protein